MTVGDQRWVAWVERTSSGQFQVAVEGAERAFPLTNVYAASITGELGTLGRGEFPRWKRRALIESGRLAAPNVTLESLAPSAPESAHRLWTAIATLVRVRAAGGEKPTDPLPLSRPFLRRWTPASDSQVRRAMEWLEQHHYIERVGRHGKLILWTVALGPR
jgi:hypothetical protein